MAEIPTLHVPDFSFIASAAQQLGESIRQIPGVIQTARILKENKVSKDDVRRGVIAHINSLDDKALAAAGTSKEQLIASLPDVGRPNTSTLQEYVKKVGAWYIPVVQGLKEKGGMTLEQIQSGVKSLPGALQGEEQVKTFAAGVSTDLTQRKITNAAMAAAGPNQKAAIGAANQKLAAQGEEPFDFTKMDPELAAQRRTMIAQREANTPGVIPQTREAYQARFGTELAQIPGGTPSEEQVKANPVATAQIAGHVPYKEPEKDKSTESLSAYQRWQMGQAHEEQTYKELQAQENSVAKMRDDITAGQAKITEYEATAKAIADLRRQIEKSDDPYDLQKQLSTMLTKYGDVPQIASEVAKMKQNQKFLTDDLADARATLREMKKTASGLTASASRRASEEKAKRAFEDSQKILSAQAPDGRTFEQMYAAGALDNFQALRDYAENMGYEPAAADAAIEKLQEKLRSASAAPPPQPAFSWQAPNWSAGMGGGFMTNADFDAMNAKYGR